MLLAFSFLLQSCGTESGKFRLKGRLRNINQGEFWIYSPDGGIKGIDTIQVRDGRFAYEMDLAGETTLVIVFPNYSEQPVFARSGSEVSIKGDATHLKEIIIEGTTDNEDLTTLRLKLNDLMPPDIPDAVSDFIIQHPRSPASLYLLQRHFIQSSKPDFQQALKLAKVMLKEQPDNGQLMLLDKQLRRLQGGALHSRLPKFTAVDLNGKKVTEAELKRPVNVVFAWASWCFPSVNMLPRLKALSQKHGDKLGMVTVCIDGIQRDCRKRVIRDSLTWSTVCDGKMWDSPLLSAFGFGDVPSNVVIDGKGRIVARNLSAQALEEKINQLVK